MFYRNGNRNKNELEKFNTTPKIEYIKSKSSPQQIQADTLAKESTRSTFEELPFYDTQNHTLHQQTFLHLAGNLQDQYPSTYIKKNYQKQKQLETEAIIKQKFKEYFPSPNFDTSNIDIKKTKELASIKHLQTNFLDCSKMSQQKFRICLINNKLPLNERLQQQNLETNSYCTHCPDKIESMKHFLSECPETKNKLSEIQKLTYQLYYERIPKRPIYQKLNIKDLITINLNHKPLLYGYFIKSTTNQIKIKLKSIRNIDITYQQAETIHFTILDSWLSAFHKIIWLKRALHAKTQIIKRRKEKKTQNRQDPVQNQIPNIPQQEDIDPEPPPQTNKRPNENSQESATQRRKLTHSKIKRPLTPENSQQTETNKKLKLTMHNEQNSINQNQQLKQLQENGLDGDR